MNKLPIIALGISTLLITAACNNEAVYGDQIFEPIPSRIALDVDSIIVDVGKEFTINPRVFDQRGNSMGFPPANAKVNWNTSDMRIVTVVDGVVRGIRPGRASVGVQVGTTSAGVRVTVN